MPTDHRDSAVSSSTDDHSQEDERSMMPESDPSEYCAYTEYDRGETVAELPNTGEHASGLERSVWEALFEVEDPEMPISVVDLGLIYGTEVEDGTATVEMTLTYTGCPARQMLCDAVREAVASVDGITDCDIHLVWSPEWSIDFVTEAGKNDLREFGVSI